LEAEQIEKERAAVRSKWKSWARGDINGQSIECNHGISLVIPDEDNHHPVTSFIDALFMYAANNSSNLNVTQYLVDRFATHQEVWDNERYREMAVNIFLSIGTNVLLQNECADYCLLLATAIAALEKYDGIGSISTLNSRVTGAKLRDLCYAITSRSVSSKLRDLFANCGSSRRDLLKFYRKRTTCSCLKRMHLHARKTQPKTGECSHCAEEKERALLMVCSRCRIAQYCSRACHIADWPSHKCDCDVFVKAENQQSK
jgi:hypothetical protein